MANQLRILKRAKDVFKPQDVLDLDASDSEEEEILRKLKNKPKDAKLKRY
jgi:hypothetical protein